MLERLSPGSGHGQMAAAPTALGAVGFGALPGSDAFGAVPNLLIPLDVLDTARSVVDLWSGTAAASAECIDGVDIATDGGLLFGCLQVDETSAGGLQAAARRAYASIFAVLGRSACTHPLRFWNYVPRINQPLDGLERYRHFNIGRQEAFLAAGRTAFIGAPAACAIGTHAASLLVVFVAARDAPVPIENPRQVSAYDYPAEYGPRSPTFSRATLAPAGDATLFVSGTASIVGHRSMHPGDPAAQTRETFVNLGALVDAANTKLNAPAFALDRLIYTVYVRHSTQLDEVRAQFLAATGAHSDAARNVVFLKGDICRAELLVEIEAVGRAA